LLRTIEDESLRELAEFWTKAQQEHPAQTSGEQKRTSRRRRRPRRKKPAGTQ
jgi:hypothetical protein